MKNPILKAIGVSIYMGLFTLGTLFYFTQNPEKPNGIISGEVTNSGTIQTGSGEPTTILENEKEYMLVVSTGGAVVDNLDISKYPKIQINSKITGGTIFYEIEPLDDIKEWGYFESDSYYFAFRFFIGDFANGGYYNTFRKSNNGVGNDLSLNLDGAVSGKTLKNGYKWIIPLDQKVIIAKDKDSYGYGYINTLEMINNNVGKELPIGGFISSIKEYPNGGWEITNIKSITIVYEGEKGAITLAK